MWGKQKELVTSTTPLSTIPVKRDEELNAHSFESTIHCVTND